jgi:hypothetical protein
MSGADIARWPRTWLAYRELINRSLLAQASSGPRSV